MSDVSSPARRGRPQRLLTVERTERLSPHLVRLHLGGPGLAPFLAEADPERLAKTDKYVKFLFAKPELGLEPPYDLDELRERLPLEDLPVRRTYTVREIDETNGSIAVDFVVHGDEGIAGPWAAAAQPGDCVSLAGPGGQFAPSPDAALPRLYLGDESAIPAIQAALEVLPPDTAGLALVELGGAEDEVAMPAPAGVEVRFIHRGDAVHGVRLVAAARALPRPDTLPEVFAHGERGAMKELRTLLNGEWGIERRALSLSAYWALGRAEDGFQAEKHEPVGQIFPEG